MVKIKNESSNTNLNEESIKFIKKSIKENSLLFLFFITPLISQLTDDIHWMKTIFLILSLIGFIIYSKKWDSIIGTFIILFSILMTARYIIIISKYKLVIGNLVGLVILFLLWNTIILVFTIIIHRNKYENDNIISQLPSTLQKIHTRSQKAKKFILRIKPLNPIIMYCIIVVTAIITFGNIYGNEQAFSTLIDKYYFSAVTFFTVGFGDISPANENAKLIAIFQMSYSNLTTIVFIPILISFFYSYIKEEK